jgi:hypothetical protein
MMMSQEACCHFLVFFLGAKDDDELGKLTIIYYI